LTAEARSVSDRSRSRDPLGTPPAIETFNDPPRIAAPRAFSVGTPIELASRIPQGMSVGTFWPRISPSGFAAESIST